MRKPIIAGNWKMNKTAASAKEFVEDVKTKIPANSKVDSVVGAPTLFLQELVEVSKGTDLKISAQNCFWENSGAYTGETSPAALSDLGINYVIIGHSERRDYFHETDEEINKKAKMIFSNGMIPILCCGESLETYEDGRTVEWIEKQIKADLKSLTAGQVSSLVIAYEPIWAIGTGKSANPEIADKICGVIRSTVEKLYDKETAESVRIQYGGSVKPENIADYMEKENIDGALVGGASLETDSFLALLNAIK